MTPNLSEMFVCDSVVSPRSNREEIDAIALEAAGRLISTNGQKDNNKKHRSTRNPGQVLRVYSSFSDNFLGSERISRILDTASEEQQSPIYSKQEENGNNLRDLEFHAYYLPPDDLPVPSFCNLLTQSRGSLERLGIFHLRLGVSHLRNTQDEALTQQRLFQQVVRSIAGLKCLKELTWDPLPSCLWDNPMHQFILLQSLSQLKGLRHLHLTMDTQHFSEPLPSQPQLMQLGQDMLDKRPMIPTLMKSLVSLRLSNCSLNMDSCKLLAKGLSQTTSSLKILDLSSSLFIEPKGCLILVDALSGNVSLQTLDLSDCQFATPDMTPATASQNSHATTGLLPSPPEVDVYHMLLEVLELYNSTLRVVKGVSFWGMGSLSREGSHMGDTLETLLTLNRSGLRGDLNSKQRKAQPANLVKSGVPNLQSKSAPPIGAWPHILRRTMPHSSTVIYQLLSRNAPSLLIDSVSPSCNNGTVAKKKCFLSTT